MPTLAPFILEIDRLAWFGVEEAGRRIHKGQWEFIERLVRAGSKA